MLRRPSPNLELGTLYAGTVHRWSNVGRGVAVIRIAGTRDLICAYQYCLQDREQLKPGDRVVFELRADTRRSGQRRYFAGIVNAEFPVDLLEALPVSTARIQ